MVLYSFQSLRAFSHKFLQTVPMLSHAAIEIIYFGEFLQKKIWNGLRSVAHYALQLMEEHNKVGI
jgi:hypothetical protein